MQEEQSPKVMNFSEINPYEMMYRNMNITVNQQVTREHAEIVARQLGYMHNAFGVIVKDFIKILSFKFQDVPQKDGATRRNNAVNGCLNSKTPSSDAMDIEEHTVSPRHSKPRQRQLERERHSPLVVERREAVQLKPNKQQQKPPNMDLFGEFAFEKDAYEVIKKPNKQTKQTTHLQEKVIKIIEGVKKKKEVRKLDYLQAEDEVNSRDRSEHGGNRFMNRDPEDGRTANKPQIPINNEPKPNIFDDFEFDLNIPPQPNPLQPLMREKSDALWELASSVPKQKPPIYEISDDQN